MARKSIQELIAQATTSFPDNTVGAITPALLRQFCLDFLDAVKPAYGQLTQTTNSAQTIELTPIQLTFDASFDSLSTETTSSTTTNSIARSERGTSTIEFSADFTAPSGRFITFVLYKDGAPTPWRITGSGRGPTNPVAVNFVAIDYADPAATYSIWVSAETDSTTTVFSNVVFLLSIDPVNSYV